MGQARGIDDLFRVADEVAHHKIELRDGELERHTEGRKRLERLCHSGSVVAVGREPGSMERAARRRGRALAFHAPRIPRGADDSGSASPESGWTPQFVTLWRGDSLQAACPFYIKDHSYGEYVFDWAWANAYEQHGLAYYPKAVVAVPFTPVPGTRLLARDAQSRTLLVQALIALCKQEELSSLHLLFGADADIAACTEAGLMLRNTVQFHWTNVAAQYATPPTRTSTPSSPAWRTTSARRSARSAARWPMRA
jgi:hypothetical protein